MHKYLIVLQKYSEEGALTNNYSYDSADTAQGIMDKFYKWNHQYYTKEDGTTGFKMYKVTLKQGAYSEVSDIDTFVSINAVEYHA